MQGTRVFAISEPSAVKTIQMLRRLQALRSECDRSKPEINRSPWRRLVGSVDGGSVAVKKWVSYRSDVNLANSAPRRQNLLVTPKVGQLPKSTYYQHRFYKGD